jgi:hypothetical protein
VIAVLSDCNFEKPQDAVTLDMRGEYWQLMEDLLPVLQPFQVATALLLTETTLSSSLVYPIVMKLKTEAAAAQRCRPSRPVCGRP